MRVLLITAAILLGATGTAAAAPPTAGAGSLGDRLFPDLGNGGYDAQSYDISYDYQPGVTTMASSVVMRARATQALSSFSLDSAVSKIGSVAVDGKPAAFRTEGEKLFVTPASAIADHASFTVRISYTADRSLDPLSPALHLPPGTDWPFKAWINTPDGFAFMGQPDRAHVFFPSNDYPGDKARFTFRVTTPSSLTAVANGSPVSRVVSGDRATSVWRTAQEIPTDITQVAVGRFREIDQTGPHGLPVRSFLTAAQSGGDDLVRRTPAELSWLEKTLGLPFPFERYGVLGVDSPYDGVALETASLSTYGAAGFLQPAERAEPVMVHEMTHQSFGDAVSVGSWDDMWLSEGHATYYQMLFTAQQQHMTFADAMKGFYDIDANQRATWGPPAHMNKAAATLLGSDAVGALSLFALHEFVGDQTFQHIEQAFYRQFHGRSARTSDYIAVASRVSGRDLTPFLTSWLYGTTTPPMPNHPDWKPGQP
ncbi:M1 family metallopeptidase [Kutzneria sp. 744]|uniref:M1 family metallopeptidase n=1 Tax=Kutzneria sp. (strain 744) TaxID=345341 RepID=UPI0003EECC5A|nr:M1 family metallopeptidase [Kutzneria sp. 744]EWM15726.1 mucin-2 [Kutzneria sp. 744]